VQRARFRRNIPRAIFPTREPRGRRGAGNRRVNACVASIRNQLNGARIRGWSKYISRNLLAERRVPKLFRKSERTAEESACAQVCINKISRAREARTFRSRLCAVPVIPFCKTIARIELIILNYREGSHRRG